MTTTAIFAVHHFCFYHDHQLAHFNFPPTCLLANRSGLMTLLLHLILVVLQLSLEPVFLNPRNSQPSNRCEK